MKVKAWKSGTFKKKPTYGIRIGPKNRAAYFRPGWPSITIEIDDDEIVVPLTAGFWDDCPEVRHPALRDWFESNRLTPWPSRKPPEFDLEALGENRFRLRQIRPPQSST